MSLEKTQKPLRDRIFGPTQRESELELEMAAVETVLAKLDTEQFKLSEALRDVEMMIDQRGWTNMYETDEDGGLSLRQIKDASKQLRELAVGNPFVKRGSQLRITYVWGGGLDFSGRNRENDKPVTMPRPMQILMEHPKNQRYLFSADAHEEFERAAFTDGNVFLLGNDATKQMQRIPIGEITADLRNPDNTEEIWAYRRVWNRKPNAADGQRETVVRWYYTDIFDGTRQKTIAHAGKRERIETGYTLLDKNFNRQIGWAYGVPDALAIIAWSRLYKEFLVNGYIMSRALARFAYKVTTSSAKGGSNASVEVALPGQAGSTAIEGAGNNLQAMMTAGRGYEFDSGRPLAAAMAAGLEVSLVGLLSDPGAGGGSYGTAQTLDAPAKATAVMRRKTWDEYWGRIFRWMGLSKRLVVTWKDLPEDSIQRILQAWTLVHDSGLFEGTVIQKGLADSMRISDPGNIPEGYMLPNNKDSLPRKDIDSDTKGGDHGGTGAGGSTAGSGQGQSSPAGTSDDDHDDDTD